MSKEDVKVSDVVRNMAQAMNFEVTEKGSLVSNKEFYVQNLGEGMVRHGAFEHFQKAAEKIVAKDTSAAERTEELVGVLTKDAERIARAIHDYDAEVFAAATLGAGEAAQAYIAKNPDVNRVTGSLHTVGRNKMDIVYDHEYTKTIPPREEGQEAQQIKAYGRANIKHNVYGNRNSAQQMVAARKELAAKAAKAAGKLSD